MAKVESDSGNTVERATQLIEIVRRIPERSYITARELQTELSEAGIELPTRKLQRYLESIVNSDFFNVECNNKGKPFGYRKNAHVVGLDGVRLTEKDCLLLRLAQEHLKYQMPPKITLGLKPLFDQARTYLNESNQGPEKKWLSKVAFIGNSVTFDAPNVRRAVFDGISKALFEEVMLEVKYLSGQKMETKKHFVHPLGLVQQDVRIYLVCVFEGYLDIRSLALHRIESVKVTAFPIKQPAGFKLTEYVKNAQAFNYDKGRWVEFSFRFTNPVTKLNLEETPFSGKGQTITKLPNGKGWLLKAVVRDSRLLDGWVAMWKKDAGISHVQKQEIKAP